ncbi:MAG: asparagine--tRNA ligase [Ruminococcus sp.]|jgi:asparaginyl-tRNA synthetase|nr:asparagine--tRNA ligase [Ruminococcus sp.]
MKRTEIKVIVQNPSEGEVCVCGWIRTIRKSKGICFIALSDGSTAENIQLVAEENAITEYDKLSSLGTGASISVNGLLIFTPEAKQPFEIKVKSYTILGFCPTDYPLQKKNHTPEFLRTIPHLRVRSNTFGNVFRVRSEASFAIHEFFRENGFFYVHTPIITDSDAEGAGEMFTVTTLNPTLENTDFTGDFFSKHASLTVSGQLEGEYMAMGLGKIYTFGPTFRAEKSFTARHAAEFWMIEPEMAFTDLDGLCETAEAMLKFVLTKLLERCKSELNFFDKFYDNGLVERLKAVTDTQFSRCSYTEAIEHLEKANADFEYTPKWGIDLQTEHERYLTEIVFQNPVFVYDYPKEIKAFYMRQNDDGKTVAACDLLVPRVGELIGGSQREERLDILKSRMAELHMDENAYSRYLDTRKYGSVYHSGFGLGFERLLMYVTGIQNIRDVIPFPRTAGTIY